MANDILELAGEISRTANMMVSAPEKQINNRAADDIVDSIKKRLAQSIYAIKNGISDVMGAENKDFAWSVEFPGNDITSPPMFHLTHEGRNILNIGIWMSRAEKSVKNQAVEEMKKTKAVSEENADAIIKMLREAADALERAREK